MRIISGGAIGSDKYWEQCAKNCEVILFTAYNFTYTNALENNYKKVYEELGKKYIDIGTYVGKLVRRNYHIAKNGDCCLAIIENRENIGGTWYTMQFAYNMGKPVFAFSQEDKRWYKFNGVKNKIIDDDTFIEIKYPTLTYSSYACVGTRNLDDVGKKAIEEIMEHILS